ncbi:1-phosphatidylinositol-4-phosphate 5-kinase [Paxillus involutus ATCC 200175]|nr:1-phosphatidylinositol-4-phosphate 5-kinase [Paxillus involutus ATCC 200175]
MSLIASAFADLATKAQASIRSRSYSEPSDRASDASSFAESSSRPKLTLRSPLSSPTTLRANEHLAVLLPKNLWKPDALASTCDNFYCHVKFSVLERRHHCRKCGGVFCHQCTSRVTHLLDVSNLDFLHPPRNVPISTFESPTSPVALEKVCDDCWDQIHRSPRSPDTRPSTPMLVTSPATTASPSPSSSICASPIEQSCLSTGGVRVKRSSSQHSARNIPFPSVMVSVASDLEASDPSLGELAAYPLRRSSIICKATGGGRWEPKHSPPKIGLRIPGFKALYEIEMEKEDAEERRRRLNPIVRDGAFQYRFRQDRIPPATLSRSPSRLSTF